MAHKTIGVVLLSVSHRSVTGGFVYVENLLSHLLRHDQSRTYTLFSSLDNYFYFKRHMGGHRNVSFRIIDIRLDFLKNPIRAFKKLTAKLTKNRHGEEEIVRGELQSLLAREHINILFFPTPTVYPQGLRAKHRVVTVFDLQHEYAPQNFSTRQLTERRRMFDHLVSHTDHLFAISEHTKEMFIKTYNLSPEKITVTPLAAAIIPETRKPAGGERGLPGQFLLYPAALWPHKNHMMVVEALARLQDEFPNLHIVFTGITKKKGVREALESRIETLGFSSRVHMLGFVRKEELDQLYRKAALLVFPSSYEGFGIPLVEAMKYGVPIVAARNTSISEVVGDAGILFETGNLEACSDAIEKALADQKLRETLIGRGKQRAHSFTWDATARKTRAVFDLLEERETV